MLENVLDADEGFDDADNVSGNGGAGGIQGGGIQGGGGGGEGEGGNEVDSKASKAGTRTSDIPADARDVLNKRFGQISRIRREFDEKLSFL